MKTMKIFFLILTFTFILSSHSFAETVISRFIKGSLPIDPSDKAWNNAVPVEVHMEAQRSIRPGIKEPVVQSVRVSSLNNGSEIVFRLQWRDPTKNDTVNMSDKFSDACAIQFPIGKGATAQSFMMGDEGKPVHIIHWKAAWEKDIAEGYQDVEHAYPNYNVDGYPLMRQVEGKAVYPVNSFTEEARAYMAGISAGNPLSDTKRGVPVEELNAEGFRTITTQSRNDARARGIWESSSWKVVIARKLNSGDPADSVLKRGESSLMSIAVWDGGSGDVGGRKSYSADGWLTLKIE
ncbi:MAG: hypothetical protein OHK0032_07100 [Thermodesulfovibrionales bacterium]